MISRIFVFHHLVVVLLLLFVCLLSLNVKKVKVEKLIKLKQS